MTSKYPTPLPFCQCGHNLRDHRFPVFYMGSDLCRAEHCQCKHFRKDRSRENG